MQGASSLIILLLFLGIMYFVLIRPQQKRQREHQEMIRKIDVGDDVITVGGLHGRVASVHEDAFDLEVTDDIVLRFQRSSIARVVNQTALEGRDDPEELDDPDDPADDSETTSGEASTS